MDFLAHTLWWEGPPWLQLPLSDCGHAIQTSTYLMNCLSFVLLLSCQEFGLKFYTFSKYVRVLVWMLRFISCTRNLSTHPSAEQQVQAQKQLSKLSQELFYPLNAEVL